MLDSDEIANLLRPILPDIIGEYFKIMEEVDSSDDILSALQVIVLKYRDAIKPMALAMVNRLFVIFAEQANQGEEDDEAVWTASQCLDTVSSILEVITYN